MILFAKRFKAATPIAVTITGTGDESRCYATINGTKYTSATTGIEVMPGDTITFGVYGTNTKYPGIVSIDGTVALTAKSYSTATYVWNVPDGITSISIAMSANTASSTGFSRNGKIIVTTA